LLRFYDLKYGSRELIEIIAALRGLKTHMPQFVAQLVVHGHTYSVSVSLIKILIFGLK